MKFFTLTIFLFISFELFLKLTGVTYLYFSNNSTQINDSNNIKILTIGESTTALGLQDSYPRLLEEFLNIDGQTFHVINKGVPATYSRKILENIDQYMNEYDPDIVIGMIGINDYEYEPLDSMFDKISSYSSIYKLINLLFNKIIKKSGNDISSGFYSNLKNCDKNSEEERRVYNLFSFQKQEEIKRMLLKDSDKLNPKCKTEVLFRYNLLYGNNSFTQKEFHSYLKSISSKSKLNEILTEIFDHDKFVTNNPFIIESTISFLEKNFHNWKGRQEWVISLSIMKASKSSNVEVNQLLDIEKKIITELKKTNMKSELLYSYYLLKKLQNTDIQLQEALLIKSIKELNKMDNAIFIAEVYESLFELYMLNDKTPEAILLLNDFKVKQPNLINYYLLFKIHLCSRSGLGCNDKDIRPLYSTKYFKLSTKENYQKIVNKVLRRGKIFISMQYPTRNIENLNFLGKHKNLYFHSNENILDLSTFDDMFYDNFAGDFGHCTRKGNQFIAKGVGYLINSIVEKSSMK